jgi:hypothetical protein
MNGEKVTAEFEINLSLAIREIENYERYGYVMNANVTPSKHLDDRNYPRVMLTSTSPKSNL